MLPATLAVRFEVVRRLRPVDLVAPSEVRLRATGGGRHPLPAEAPYVAAVTPARAGAVLALHLGGARLGAELRDGTVGLTVTGDGGTRRYRSRRHHRARRATELGLTLTGPHLTAWCREDGAWVARARRDLRDDLDVRDEAPLRGLELETPG